MFSLASELLRQFFNRPRKKIVLFGPGGAGKSSLLESIRAGVGQKSLAPGEVIPTVGLILVDVKFGGVDFTFWDLGGGFALRNIWNAFLTDADAIIYLWDASDPDVTDESFDDLKKIMCDQRLVGKSVPIFVFLSKAELIPPRKKNQVLQSLVAMIRRGSADVRDSHRRAAGQRKLATAQASQAGPAVCEIFAGSTHAGAPLGKAILLSCWEQLTNNTTPPTVPRYQLLENDALREAEFRAAQLSRNWLSKALLGDPSPPVSESTLCPTVHVPVPEMPLFQVEIIGPGSHDDDSSYDARV